METLVLRDLPVRSLPRSFRIAALRGRDLLPENRDAFASICYDARMLVFGFNAALG